LKYTPSRSLILFSCSGVQRGGGVHALPCMPFPAHVHDVLCASCAGTVHWPGGHTMQRLALAAALI
jgi:hypothetical protein